MTHAEDFAFIHPTTGQVKMEITVHSRRTLHSKTAVPGCCTWCASTLDGNTTGALVAYEDGVPVVGHLVEIGDPICYECELFIGNLGHYYKLGARHEFGYEVGDIVRRRGHEEYFRIISRRHDGLRELRTWWPVYTCRVLDVQPGLLPRERDELEVDFPEHELESMPRGLLGERLSASAPPPPITLLESPPPPALPECEPPIGRLPFPSRPAIC